MSRSLYDTAKLGPNQTRVLVVEPSAKIKDPIICRLEVATLSAGFSSIDFDALSYVWGDLTDKREIQINGMVMSVTTSLEKAIRYLRNRKRTRRLWADAVCINQNDIPERNIQVQIMADVYRDAQKVLLWLGEPDKDIDKTIKWMKSTLPCGTFEILESQKVAQRTKAKHSASDAGMKKIIEHSYWHRMWTCQEFALASWDPIVICGHNSFEAGYLWPALEAKDMLKDMTMLWTENGNTNNGFTAEFPCIQTSILIRHAMMRRGQLPYRLAPSLGLFLSMTCPRGCEDPKDKVYALYGLIDEKNRLPPPDYSKPLEDVVKETVAFLVNDQNDMDIYSFLGINSKSERPDFASWLPNLSDGNLNSPTCPAHYVSRRLCSYGGLKFRVDEATSYRSQVSEDLSSLVLHGIFVDPIRHSLIFGKTIGEIRTQVIYIQQLLVERRQSTVSNHLNGRTANSSIPTLTEIIKELGGQSLWLNLTPRIEDTADFLQPEDVEDEFQSFLNEEVEVSSKKSIGHKTPARSALESALQHMYGRSFFITENGVFGVSVPDIEDGDDLVLLYGFKIPYVLRRSRQHFGAKLKLYHMIGGSYVSGIMLGELSPIDDLRSRMTEIRII
jgi:hypothetical protein